MTTDVTIYNDQGQAIGEAWIRLTAAGDLRWEAQMWDEVVSRIEAGVTAFPVPTVQGLPRFSANAD